LSFLCPMAIKDLQARQGNVNITLDIIEKSDVREFEKFGKKGRVCNAKGKDSTGTITLTLWNDDIDKINAGDSVKIENGWVSEWQGDLQLSTGKFGKMEVVGKASAAATPSKTAPSDDEEIVDTPEVVEETIDEDPDTDESEEQLQ